MTTILELPRLADTWTTDSTVAFYNEINDEKIVMPNGCWELPTTPNNGGEDGRGQAAFFTREFLWQFTFGRDIGTRWLSAACDNVNCIHPMHAQLNEDNDEYVIPAMPTVPETIDDTPILRSAPARPIQRDTTDGWISLGLAILFSYGLTFSWFMVAGAFPHLSPLASSSVALVTFLTGLFFGYGIAATAIIPRRHRK